MRRPPKYCHWKRGRRGSAGYWYYTRPGYPRVRLPGLPWSPEFMRAYENAEREKPLPEAAKAAAGTLNALIVAYYGSPQWKRLAPSTQRTYRRILERMRAKYGDGGVANLRRSHLQKIVDGMADTPTAANRFLSMMVSLFDLALRQEWLGVERNVARDVEPISYKKRGFHTWTDAEIDNFRVHWPMGSRERLAFELLLCTAQRSGDVRSMAPRQIANDTVSVTQQKTGACVIIPLLPELRDALAAAPIVGTDTILVTSQGRPFTEKYFYIWFKRACVGAGVPRCCPHGLRKAAARRLAEAGCTPHQIASHTGHDNLRQIELYTRAAERAKLARQATEKLRKTIREQET